MALLASDFDRLFADGTRHTLPRGDVVTVALRRDSSLWLPSGQVVAGDPFLLGDDDDGFAQRVPPGRYPVELVVARFAKRGYLRAHEMVAAARLVIRDEPVASWHMAVSDGQDVAELDADEFFGFPVDSGVACFADPTTVGALCADPEDYLGKLARLGIGERDDATSGALTDDGEPLLVAFPSGGGDGHYPTWVGHTEAGEPACFLTDFSVLPDVVPGHRLSPGQTLHRQAVNSPEGSHTLIHTDDGNLVLYHNGGRGTVWSANTGGLGTAGCLLQADGDFVIRDEQTRVVWSTETAGYPGSVLDVRDDGLELRASDGTVLWSVQTAIGTPVR